MGAIQVLSPYDGQGVKIRAQDVGRAVRDREGRVFYVLMRSDGQGHYSSITRTGGRREEQQYLELEAKVAAENRLGREQSLAQVRDLTGRRRSWRGRLVIVIFILIALAVVAAWFFTVGPLGGRSWQAPPAPQNPVPLDPAPPPAVPPATPGEPR